MPATASSENGEQARPGTALLRQGVLAFGGAIVPTEVHAHHAVQIVAACTPVTVVDASGLRQHGTHFIVPTDAPHRIASGTSHGTAIYLDPETAAGVAADRTARTRGWLDSGRALPVDPARGALAEHVAEAVHQLQGTDTTVPNDARHSAVTTALRLLPALVRDGPVRGADIARDVGISPTRLTHLFTEQVGIPLRRYIFWLRLHSAITHVRGGDDLAAAARGAGFADTADLARACRRGFGLPPSVLSRTLSWDLG